MAKTEHFSDEKEKRKYEEKRVVSVALKSGAK